MRTKHIADIGSGWLPVPLSHKIEADGNGPKKYEDQTS
jgi:hypothetical protein